MNKEKIKEKCLEIEKALNDGKTPQEIAETFNASGHSEGRENCDCEYEYEEYIVDFPEGFGITFWQIDDGDWHWENEDEIWLFETEDFAHWKSL